METEEQKRIRGEVLRDIDGRGDTRYPQIIQTILGFFLGFGIVVTCCVIVPMILGILIMGM